MRITVLPDLAPHEVLPVSKDKIHIERNHFQTVDEIKEKMARLLQSNFYYCMYQMLLLCGLVT